MRKHPTIWTFSPSIMHFADCQETSSMTHHVDDNVRFSVPLIRKNRGKSGKIFPSGRHETNVLACYVGQCHRMICRDRNALPQI